MKALIVRLVLVVPGLAVVASMEAQTVPGWTQRALVGPSARVGHAMVFDSARGRVVLFGGETGGTHHGDTWTWDGNTWTLAATMGPTPRFYHAMAFDSARGRVVLFGGQDNSGPIGDTWEWDGTAWLPQFFATGPAARHNHELAFDSARGRTVLFGGAGAAPVASYLSTWEWDGTSWLQAATGGAPGRDSFAMAFDSARGKTVLLGGRSVPGSAVIDDTWEWDGSTWLQASTGLPRVSHGMEFDGARVVLFGGGPGVALADFREWTGSSWAPFSYTGPSARLSPAMAFDSLRGKLVLFGGSLGTANSELGDTWEWDRGGIPAAAAYGNGCGSPALSLSAVASALPHLNTTAQVSLANVPSPLAFVALGLSNTLFNAIPLPVTLASIGMPGCFLRQSSEVVGEAATMTGPGTASYSFAIPNNPALIGFHVYLQAWAWAPGANPANIVVSNGLDWRIGY